MTSRRNGRKPAPRLAPRRVDVEIGQGELAGWSFSARADFPMAWLADLQSGDVVRIIAALDRIVLEHNFPDDAGELALSLGDVDQAAIQVVLDELTEAVKRLPPR